MTQPEPKPSPKIQEFLSLEFSMDVISGRLPVGAKDYKDGLQQTYGPTTKVTSVLAGLGIIAILTGAFFALNTFFILAILISGAGIIALIHWLDVVTASRLTDAFALTRSDFILHETPYPWGEIQGCEVRKTHLDLLFTDGRKIAFGYSPKSKGNSLAVQWLCDVITHRAASAGTEQDLPEAVKAMRRQPERTPGT